ncbi:MAG: 4Fe-4S binding protein [Anaerolineae bacterium]|nr:4Fe-4S binding protein [Anaerolineae bacterium]
MCLTCGKHVAERLWYLDPERHRIRSFGAARDMFTRYMHPIIFNGLRVTGRKQPYGQHQFDAISKQVLTWVTKTFHGVQILPDLDSAFQVIDMSNELALVPCLCKQIIAPDEPLEWRCLSLNVAAQVYFKKDSPYPVRPITKQQAKDLTAGWRERGAFQSTGWLWDAHVVWICNCDMYCASHRSTEVVWGAIPSFVVSTLVRPEACAGCRECASWCQRDGALTFGADGRVVIDPALCRGCGLCIEHCSQGALGFTTRRFYYDIVQKEARELDHDFVHL